MAGTATQGKSSVICSGAYAGCVRSIALIGWPYDLGYRGVGMGLGAQLLFDDQDLRDALAVHAAHVSVETVDPVDERTGELARIFELDRRLATAVAMQREAGRFPLVLAGNCISCVGTVGGCGGGRRLGVMWLDAHADFDTPEDNLSGYSDVLGLSILTGSAWPALRRTVPGLEPVVERNVILAGTRDLVPYQRDRLARSDVTVVPGRIDRGAFARAVGRLRERVGRVYLHVDLDVLDTGVGRANAYATPGGPDLDAVVDHIGRTFASFQVQAAAITAYDPACDPNRQILVAARQIATTIASAATGKASEQRYCR